MRAARGRRDVWRPTFYKVVSVCALRSELRRTWREIFEAIDKPSAYHYSWARNAEIEVEARWVDAGGEIRLLDFVKGLALGDVVGEECGL